MKKKSNHEIPDFSRHSSRVKGAGTPDATVQPKSKMGHGTPPRPRPQAPSSKSGQRGK